MQAKAPQMGTRTSHGDEEDERAGPYRAGWCLLAGAHAAQACCLDGGHGAPAAAAAGLSEALPKARNLALDPAWRIYEFSRDGVTCLQINDATDTVRAAVVRVNDTL